MKELGIFHWPVGQLGIFLSGKSFCSALESEQMQQQMNDVGSAHKILFQNYTRSDLHLQYEM